MELTFFESAFDPGVACHVSLRLPDLPEALFDVAISLLEFVLNGKTFSVKLIFCFFVIKSRKIQTKHRRERLRI